MVCAEAVCERTSQIFVRQVLAGMAAAMMHTCLEFWIYATRSQPSQKTLRSLPRRQTHIVCRIYGHVHWFSIPVVVNSGRSAYAGLSAYEFWLCLCLFLHLSSLLVRSSCLTSTHHEYTRFLLQSLSRYRILKNVLNKRHIVSAIYVQNSRIYPPFTPVLSFRPLGPNICSIHLPTTYVAVPKWTH